MQPLGSERTFREIKHSAHWNHWECDELWDQVDQIFLLVSWDIFLTYDWLKWPRISAFHKVIFVYFCCLRKGPRTGQMEDISLKLLCCRVFSVLSRSFKGRSSSAVWTSNPRKFAESFVSDWRDIKGFCFFWLHVFCSLQKGQWDRIFNLFLH